MPQARRSTTTTARRPRALDRLEKSIDAAQSALKDLRTELGRGGRDLVTDLDKTLRDSRKNVRNLKQDGLEGPREAAEGSDRQDARLPGAARAPRKTSASEPLEVRQEVATSTGSARLESAVSTP